MAGIIPTPAYKDIVTAESVSVNFFIIISDIDQIKDEVIINKPPRLIDISGLNTIMAPKNPTLKAASLLNLISSFKNIIAKIDVKIGTVKFNAVTSDNVVRVRP